MGEIGPIGKVMRVVVAKYQPIVSILVVIDVGISVDPDLCSDEFADVKG